MRRIWELISGRLLLGLVAIGILMALLWAFRYPVLRGVGNFLITADAIEPSDAVYALGGSPLERGAEAAHLLRAGMAPVAYCTGLNVPASLQAEGLLITEAEQTRKVALKAGAHPAQVELLVVGTSTWEESEAILLHARQQGYKSIILVSTEFHLRRVGRVFRKRFAREGVDVRLHAAPSVAYNSERWWESEEGLLMVNNEYVKLLYYWIKY
jgi:uncharacterized SAM-binding protein YcdF (DUF218 family)